MTRHMVLSGEWDKEIKAGLKEALILIEITNPFSREDLLDALNNTGVGIREIFMTADEAIMDELEIKKYHHLWTEIIELPSLEDIILPKKEIKNKSSDKMKRYTVLSGDCSAAGHGMGADHAEILIKEKNPKTQEELFDIFKDKNIVASEIYTDLEQANLTEMVIRQESGLYSLWVRIVELPPLEDALPPKDEEISLYILQSDVIDFINELGKYGIYLEYSEADSNKENHGLNILMPGLNNNRKTFKLYSQTIRAGLFFGTGHAEISLDIWGEEELTDREFDELIGTKPDD